MPQHDEPQEKDTSGLARQLVDKAVADTGDTTLALCVLMQAAGALVMARITPPRGAVILFEGAAELVAQQLSDWAQAA